MPVAKSGGSRELVPAGNYFAVVVGCFDLGTQPGGQYGPKHQVLLQYELHKKKGVVRNADGDPILMAVWYGLTFGEKATLRKHAQAILGRAFSQDEAKHGYDVADLLDRACRVVVSHYESGGEMRDGIDTVMPLDEDDPTPEPVSSASCYDLIPGKPIPSTVPEWIQKQILRSQEFRGVRSGAPEPAGTDRAAGRRGETGSPAPGRQAQAVNGNGRRPSRAAATAVADDDGDNNDDIPF